MEHSKASRLLFGPLLVFSLFATLFTGIIADLLSNTNGIGPNEKVKQLGEFGTNTVHQAVQGEIGQQIEDSQTAKFEEMVAVKESDQGSSSKLDGTLLQSIMRKIATGDVQSSDLTDKRNVEKIGDLNVRKSQVANVGDINGDGFEDLVVAAPQEDSNKGNVRLYMMGADRSVISSQDLVPGKAGILESPLEEGDSYGDSVTVIDDLDGNNVREIAIGASGDGSGGKGSGAVYVLMMNADGTVRRHAKISAGHDESLRKQMTDGEGFGSLIQKIEDVNGDGVAELAVGSKSGATTLLFLDREGNSQVGVRFHPESATMAKDSKAIMWDEKELSGSNMKVAEPLLSAASRKLSSVSLPEISVRSGQCFYNDTACQCALTTAVVGSQTCYDEVGADSLGHTVCKARDCRPSYTCTCEGTEYCERSEETRSIFRYHGPYTGGNVLCHQEKVTQTITKLIPGAPIPMMPRDVPAVVIGGSNGYNDTHCLCSFKKDVVGSPTCLDFARFVPSSAVICTTRPCRIKDDDVICDMDGKMLCKHEEIMTKTFVNNGPVAGSSNEVYCHQQVGPWDQTTLC